MATRDAKDKNLAKDPGHHASAAGAPGASGPGEPGYDGDATVGDEGAAAGPESFVDPNGTNEKIADAASAALQKRVDNDEDGAR